MITAVVVAYWPDRYKHIPEIVDALKRQTMSPDNIIVFNNNKDHHLAPIHGAKVINSGANFTSRSKYPIALLIPSQYYFLLDDDVVPQDGVIENFFQYARPGCCMSDYGILMTSNHFHKGKVIKGHKIRNPKGVDSFIGRTQFVSMSAIAKMLQLEVKVRLDEDEFLYDGEDILIAMANPNSIIVPTSEGSHCPTIEGSQEVSMQDDWGYHILRDIFAYKVRKIIGLKVWDDLPVPGDEYDIQAMEEYKETVRKRS